MAMTNWDRNAVNVNNFNQQQTSQQRQQGTTQVDSSQTTQTRQAQSTAQQNVTPTALSAIDTLIAQLMDRPNISEAELDAQAPLAQKRYTNGEWTWFDPLTGRTMSFADAQQFNAEREVERQRLQEEAGITRGGTEAQRQASISRDESLRQLTKSIEDYSKGAAREDASGIVNQIIRQVQEGQLASLTRSAEAAGTSQSTIRGLMSGDIAARAGEAGAVAAGKIAADYGNVQANLANALTQAANNDPVLNSLLEALNISKGAVSFGSSVTSGKETTKSTQRQSVDQLTQSADVTNRRGSGGNLLSSLVQGATI